jgi:TonB family protein
MKIIAFLFLLGSVCLGQSSPPYSTAKAALESSASHLREENSQPFHLNAEFDASGKVEFTGHGSFEEFWVDAHHWKRTVSLGSYHAEEIQDGTRHSLTANDKYEPKRVLTVIREVGRQPLIDESKESQWQVTETSAGTVQYRLSYPKQNTSTTVYTFEKSTNRLLKIEGPAFITSFGSFITFEDNPVPMAIQKSTASGDQVLTIRITQLEPLVNRSLAAPVPGAAWNEAVESLLPPEINTKDVLPPKIRKAPDPKYPEGEKRGRSEGLVLVDLALDNRGVIREPEVVNQAEPDFLQAALDAIRKWKLEPAKLNTGLPIEANIRIEMMFRIR